MRSLLWFLLISAAFWGLPGTASECRAVSSAYGRWTAENLPGLGCRPSLAMSGVRVGFRMWRFSCGEFCEGRYLGCRHLEESPDSFQRDRRPAVRTDFASLLPRPLPHGWRSAASINRVSGESADSRVCNLRRSRTSQHCGGKIWYNICLTFRERAIIHGN